MVQKLARADSQTLKFGSTFIRLNCCYQRIDECTEASQSLSKYRIMCNISKKYFFSGNTIWNAIVVCNL